MRSDAPQVIINADDLGYSVPVNDAILGLMERGRVSSATVMATAPGVEDAATRSRDLPRCSFGAHLCLTEFEPLTKAGRELPFVGADGRFDANAFAQVKPDAQIRAKVHEEWCGQIRRLQSLGIKISHLDSHHHVHTRPWLFPVLKAVQRTFDIRKVRISLNLYYCPEHDPGWRLLFKKMLFNAALRRNFPTRTTDLFTNFRWYRLISAKQPVRARSIELMCHPGGPSFAEETELLGADSFEDFRRTHQIISYHELAE